MLRNWLNQAFGLDGSDDPSGIPPDPESLEKNMIVHELQADVDRIETCAAEEESFEAAGEHQKIASLPASSAWEKDFLE